MASFFTCTFLKKILITPVRIKAFFYVALQLYIRKQTKEDIMHKLYQ